MWPSNKKVWIVLNKNQPWEIEVQSWKNNPECKEENYVIIIVYNNELMRIGSMSLWLLKSP